MVVSGSADTTLIVWDPLTKNELDVKQYTLRGHTGPVTSVLVVKQADQKHIILSGSTDGTIRLWDPEKQAEMVHYRMFWMDEFNTKRVPVHSLALLPRTGSTANSPWSTDSLIHGRGEVVVQGSSTTVRGASLAAAHCVCFHLTLARAHSWSAPTTVRTRL
jgi:WD40 repeat protein